ncbi:hypothetical protein Ahy_A03g015230 isoform B [Arachis hypogaea]|uniref:Uncharacterized protein n=1 Tax=Arachis hypogaea TaxID=3818 RepID=A0A445E056_ARAHY|nr:hypothetical protein Ahy_A03g015230 isoform B [Arachis hypogaea]
MSHNGRFSPAILGNLGDEATLRMKTAIRIVSSYYSELKALVNLKVETVEPGNPRKSVAIHDIRAVGQAHWGNEFCDDPVFCKHYADRIMYPTTPVTVKTSHLGKTLTLVKKCTKSATVPGCSITRISNLSNESHMVLGVFAPPLQDQSLWQRTDIITNQNYNYVNTRDPV